MADQSRSIKKDLFASAAKAIPPDKYNKAVSYPKEKITQKKNTISSKGGPYKGENSPSTSGVEGGKEKK